MPQTPDWLTARPIAHRGLHGTLPYAIENTLPAFEAAIERGFAIELDVQVTRDGDAMVFHDDMLDRLTPENGAVRDRTRAELETIPVTGSGTTIPSLAKVLADVDGRTPLIVELKSRFDHQMTLSDAVVGLISGYSGPLALMSFDPAIMTVIRQHKTSRPLGIVSTAMSVFPQSMPFWKRMRLGALAHGPGLWCDFVSYDQAHLPNVSATLARWLGRKAMLCWTVKDPVTAARMRRLTDQITFEGFDPFELGPGTSR